MTRGRRAPPASVGCSSVSSFEQDRLWETKRVGARTPMRRTLRWHAGPCLAGNQQFIGGGHQVRAETGRGESALQRGGRTNAESFAFHGGIPPRGAHFNRNRTASLG